MKMPTNTLTVTVRFFILGIALYGNYSLASDSFGICNKIYSFQQKTNAPKAVLVHPVSESNFNSAQGSEIDLLQLKSGENFVRLPDGKIIPVQAMPHKTVREEAPGRQPKYIPTPAQLPAIPPPPPSISELDRTSNSNPSSVIKPTTRRVIITDMNEGNLDTKNVFQMAKWPSGVGPRSRPNKKRDNSSVVDSNYDQNQPSNPSDTDGSGSTKNKNRRNNYDGELTNERGQNDEYRYGVLFITPQGQVFAPDRLSAH